MKDLEKKKIYNEKKTERDVKISMRNEIYKSNN